MVYSLAYLIGCIQCGSLNLNISHSFVEICVYETTIAQLGMHRFTINEVYILQKISCKSCYIHRYLLFQRKIMEYEI